jgi:hypothetical protein
MTKIEIGSIRKMYCNSCKGETHHEVLAVHSRQHDEIENEETPYPQLVFWAEYEYRFWVCRGCDTATLEAAYTDVGMYDPNKDDYIYESDYYPQRERRVWAKKHFRHLDQKLGKIYKEAITCFNADANIACAMCLRALIEGVCVNKGITDQTAWGLENKLKKLEEGNHLPSNILECLLSFKFIGDDAAHRLLPATRNELEAAIGVMEDLLNFLYEAEYELVSKAQKLATLRSTDIEDFRKRKTKTSQSTSKETTEQ